MLIRSGKISTFLIKITITEQQQQQQEQQQTSVFNRRKTSPFVANDRIIPNLSFTLKYVFSRKVQCLNVTIAHKLLHSYYSQIPCIHPIQFCVVCNVYQEILKNFDRVRSTCNNFSFTCTVISTEYFVLVVLGTLHLPNSLPSSESAHKRRLANNAHISVI